MPVIVHGRSAVSREGGVVRMWLRARLVAVLAAACCLAGGVVADAPDLPAAAASAGAVYVPLGPVRVLDTRNGVGHSGAVGPNSAISLQITGNHGVPDTGVTAAVLNVTAVSPTSSSYVTVYPDGQGRPNASNLNFTAGETIPNLVTVPVSDGKVDFYNHSGTVSLVADLAGYYTTSGTGSFFDSAGPVRALDTRNGIGHSGAVGPNSAISLQITGNDGVPDTGVTAAVLNVTAVSPTSSSYVTVYPDGQARPNVSNLNFTAGETIPNLVVVPVSDGKVDFYNHSGTVSLVADLAGYFYAGGSQYNPLGPVRVLDTRTGTGHSGAVGPNSAISLQVTGTNGVPAGVTAVVINVTATGATAGSYVTVYPDGQPRPTASDLNFTAGETIPNLVVVPVGSDGKVDFYNFAGSVNLVADLTGYYTAGGAPWGNAIEVPGTATLNTGGFAEVTSVSCPSAGNCAVAGDYFTDNGVHYQAFVADEVNSAWGNAIEVPGTAALNTGGHASVHSLSCGSPGNCAAGGDYDSGSGYQAFVADEVNGTWDSAIEVPGTAALNTGGSAEVFAVSCPSAGNCAASGEFANSSGIQAFVADELNGTWGNAIEVPGTAALNTGGTADAFSVSCGSPGNCAVGGEYFTDSSGHHQAFVADEVNGAWGKAIEVPGTATLNTSDSASVDSVSCPSAGNCAAGGSYSDSSGTGQAFVADEVNGTWGKAIEVPGTATLNARGAAVSSLSCGSAGNCAAGGTYDSPTTTQAFVVSEVNGTWGSAIQIPGTAGPALVLSASCAPAGSCAVGGYYFTGSGYQAFIVSEMNGTWGEATALSGTAAPNTNPNATVSSVSCPSAGTCAAGGHFIDSSNHGQAFVVSQN